MLRELVLSTLGAAGLLLHGCGAPAPAAPGRRVETGTTGGPAGEAATAARAHDAELRPDMEALLRAREEFFARAGTVGASSSAPPARRVRATPRKGAIPTDRVARIEALSFNRRAGNGPECAAAEEPFAPDGRVCGDVRLPVATLRAEEVMRVLRLLRDAENTYGPKAAGDGRSRPVTRCEFDPHHALALYDDAGEVLGTIVICMSCAEWLVRPSSPGTGEGKPSLLDEEERAALASILNDHRLGAWIFGEEDPLGGEVAAYERALYGTEAEPTPRGAARRRRRLEANPSGVDRSKRLVELTSADRGALCTWVAESVRPARHDARGGEYECTNGALWSVSYGENDCGARPLRCSATVAELEACLRELHEPDDLCGPSIAECKSLMPCLPGIVPASPASPASPR